MDTFKTIVPKDKDLLKFISFYYFHDSKNENYYKDITFYPHYLVALNVYKGVKIEWEENGKIYVPTESDELEVIITINNKTSKKVKLRGAFEKIGIVFHPLGINHFIHHQLNSIISDTSASSFDYFGNKFITTSKMVYDEHSLYGKRDLLDLFFKSHLTNFKDLRLARAIDEIFNSRNMHTVQELADILSISRKTLLRIFKKHLCFTVEEFKSVVKFRKALKFYEDSTNKPKLTHVAYDNQYYDQSDFINHFKSITGLNPSRFFSTIKDISQMGTFWTFKNE